MKRRKLVPYWDENTCSQVSKSTIAEINNNDRAFVRFIFKICLEIFINAYTPCKQRGKQNGFLVITKQADFCIISCNIVVALVAPILPVSNFFYYAKIECSWNANKLWIINPVKCCMWIIIIWVLNIYNICSYHKVSSIERNLMWKR